MKTEDIPAFLYKWTDHKYDMYYIGCHKGQPNDGYICSSKYMLKEYRERPEDFTREILLIGEFEYIREMEIKYLESVDAAKNPKYYNRNNGSNNFKISMSGEENPMYGKSGPLSPVWGKKQTEEHIEKRVSGLRGVGLSKERKDAISRGNKGKLVGEKNHNYGKPKSKEIRGKISKTLKESGKVKGKNNPNYQFNPEEVLQYPKREAVEIFGLSESLYYKLAQKNPHLVSKEAKEKNGERKGNKKYDPEEVVKYTLEEAMEKLGISKSSYRRLVRQQSQ